MSNTASNVTVGKPKASGGVYSAPTGTALPTDATTALNVAFLSLGYCSDDGLTNSVELENSDIFAWGGDRVLTVRTSRSESFKFTMIETLSLPVLKEVYGQTNVTEVASKLTVIHNNTELPIREYVFELLVTGNKVKRIVVPAGKITEVGDVVYVDGEPVGYEVTLATSPDASGNTAYEYVAAIV